KQVRYGSPLVVAQRYGRGRVVAVMTTAGRGGERDNERWNAWQAQPSYVPMILEMQTYMTSLGSESNLKVGDSIRIDLGKGHFQSNVKRTYFMPWLERMIENRTMRAATPAGGKPVAVQDQKAETFTTDFTADKDLETGRQFLLVKNFYKPGFYRFDLTVASK